MRTKRALGLAAALMVAAVVSAGCNGTIGPALTSPITGSSDVLFSPGFPPDYEHQHATVNLCSLGGGPATLNVHIPDATSNTYLDVGSTVDNPQLFYAYLGPGQVGVDNNLTSEFELAPRQCATIQIHVSNGGLGNPAPPFSYTVSW